MPLWLQGPRRRPHDPVRRSPTRAEPMRPSSSRRRNTRWTNAVFSLRARLTVLSMRRGRSIRLGVAEPALGVDASSRRRRWRFLRVGSRGREVVHDDGEVVLQRLDGIDHDLRLPQRLVATPPTLHPLPRQFVPARDPSTATVDSAAVNVDVAADALEWSTPLRPGTPPARPGDT